MASGRRTNLHSGECTSEIHLPPADHACVRNAPITSAFTTPFAHPAIGSGNEVQQKLVDEAMIKQLESHAAITLTGVIGPILAQSRTLDRKVTWTPALRLHRNLNLHVHRKVTKLQGPKRLTLSPSQPLTLLLNLSPLEVSLTSGPSTARCRRRASAVSRSRCLAKARPTG